MQPAASSHAHWSSRFGFLMAAIGSAVGLGNFWRFPYLAGENGGGAFVLVYIGVVLLIAVPILFSELMIGRRTGLNAVVSPREMAKESGGSGFWIVAGVICTFSAFAIFTFYSVVAGWVMAYIPKAAAGELTGKTAQEVQKIFDALTGNPGEVILWHSVYMGLTVLIVARGLNAGIETASKILMPLFFLMLLAMVGYSAYIGLRDCGAGQACGFDQAVDFLFVPDWSELKFSSVLDAVGQAFFSVGVGVAIMLTYGAYMRKEAKIPANGLIIALSDTTVALLAGLAIFPIVFATGQDPAQGPRLLFVTLTYSLGQMPAGEIFGAMFFTLGFFAAITSSISMLEIVTLWAKEQHGVPRFVGAVGFGLIGWLIGLGTVYSFSDWKDYYPLDFIPALKEATIFDTLDYITSNFTMPLGGLLLAILAGWVIRRQIAKEELQLPPALLLLWRTLIQFIVPLALIFMMLTGLGIMTFTDTGVCFDAEFAKTCVDL